MFDDDPRDWVREAYGSIYPPNSRPNNARIMGAGGPISSPAVSNPWTTTINRAPPSSMGEANLNTQEIPNNLMGSHPDLGGTPPPSGIDAGRISDDVTSLLGRGLPREDILRFIQSPQYRGFRGMAPPGPTQIPPVNNMFVPPHRRVPAFNVRDRTSMVPPSGVTLDYSNVEDRFNVRRPQLERPSTDLSSEMPFMPRSTDILDIIRRSTGRTVRDAGWTDEQLHRMISEYLATRPRWARFDNRYLKRWLDANEHRFGRVRSSRQPNIEDTERTMRILTDPLGVGH
jgi:hypothetical protein